MKTYEDNGHRYYYDRTLRFWVIYKIDSEGNQVDDSCYYNDKKQLKENHPEIKG